MCACVVCVCVHVCLLGNYGSRLEDDPDLYISRDGGLRWEQVRDMFYYFQQF